VSATHRNLHIWKHHAPTRIQFGFGAFSWLGDTCRGFGKRGLIVTTPDLAKIGLVRTCQGILDEAGLQSVVLANITSEPTLFHIDEVLNTLRATPFDFIVGLGGGSAMDAAKAAGAIIHSPGSAEQHLCQGGRIDGPALPVVAVPTTAGTGAELSCGAIITSPSLGMKTGMRGVALFPSVAIVDPDLTRTLPADIVRVTGFDVFCHAVETWVSTKSTPITLLNSRDATYAICKHLPLLLANRSDDHSREMVSYCSMMMGINLANSSTCLPHRMQYPLGFLTNRPHAEGLAAIYPSWFDHASKAKPHLFDEIAARMTAGLRDAGVLTDTTTPTETLRSFMKTIGLTPRLSDAGVTESTCIELAKLVSGALENDPSWHKDMDISELYLKSR
jgi:alcohol dehydrogenase class IV